jgi:hypothetical protein
VGQAHVEEAPFGPGSEVWVDGAPGILVHLRERSGNPDLPKEFPVTGFPHLEPPVREEDVKPLAVGLSPDKDPAQGNGGKARDHGV